MSYSVISIMPGVQISQRLSLKCDTSGCIYLGTDTADVSVDVGSEEAEDSDFWEGVTKPGSSKTTASQQESQVWKHHLPQNQDASECMMPYRVNTLRVNEKLMISLFYTSSRNLRTSNQHLLVNPETSLVTKGDQADQVNIIINAVVC